MNLLNRLIVFFISALVLLFSACKKENRCDCIKRTGDIISEVRTVKAFDRLQVEQNVNVFITEDNITILHDLDAVKRIMSSFTGFTNLGMLNH